ncbi:threonine synthase [Cocleimonas sp. KMM 6892]|uniref:threonine synthase n=1 Tax=unclassified Cocleimonas TaxID=2639732 RepID=UPI002DBF6318|nr:MULTISPECIES: threonine synthase [unclassified Cocleimonas]MEB8433980.1 threonine synthase [Cocleimonas sp. KMM 6892]MEC4716791.1 threonine synthase [Cocleimonas sp. KMM 6895]MEC4746054.1 threonine synthase [Cocleimonas sp. KMM 6896]
MKFIETRGNDGTRATEVSFSEAILGPMSSFGGIYSPEYLPDLGTDFLQSHLDKDYKALARDILAAFNVDIDQSDIETALNLYDEFDNSENPAPLVKVKDDLYVSELYHGPTRAFKDMALQPFGVVLSSIAQKRDEEYLILAATSGDTGPAALETFKNRKNVRVACLYPDGGTSDVQRLQMVTEDAENLKVIGIHGDFDDAQSALKLLLSSESFNAKLKEKNISLSAANSVNFGRIIFQLMYHIHSYLELVRQGAIELGDKVYLNVPSGNFGNALGGYYAMRMGLPVEKILIASNQNNVLTHLINEGIYDISDSSVIPTSSPAMDILKSSNVERILFDLFGSERTKELMSDLDTDKRYALIPSELAEIQKVFSADFCTNEEGQEYIKQAFEAGYLMDPHTATCFKTYDTCRDKPLKTIVYSTAEWTKFSPTIANALTGEDGGSDKEALQAIASKANIEIPGMISSLFDKEITQSTVIDKQDIEKEILAFLD